METFAYLQLAQDFENPEEKELTFLQDGFDVAKSLRNLKLSNQAALLALGAAACSVGVLGTPHAAQAFPVAYGDADSDVTYLQKLLVENGYLESQYVTGTFADLTYEALTAFQADQGLVVDGVAGSATIGALEGLRGLKPEPSTVVAFGDSGDTVSELQKLLSGEKYLNSQNITGYFGNLTQAALIKYQTEKGLVADGVAGPLTLASLRGAQVQDPDVTPDTGSTLAFGDRGDAVKTMQTALAKQGFYFGAADGIFGSGTESAVKDFQKSAGLTQDGVYGPKTAAALTKK